jgi:hypothetical protein
MGNNLVLAVLLSRGRILCETWLHWTANFFCAYRHAFAPCSEMKCCRDFMKSTRPATEDYFSSYE